MTQIKTCVYDLFLSYDVKKLYIFIIMWYLIIKRFHIHMYITRCDSDNNPSFVIKNFDG